MSPHPLELVGDLPPETLTLTDAAARAEQPISAELRVDKDGDNFLVTGWLKTSLSLLCGRCAVWFPYPVRVEVGASFGGSPS